MPSIQTAWSSLGLRPSSTRNLRGLHWCRDSRAARRSGPGEQDGDVPVLEVITAVLGDLFLAAGLDDPVLRNADHIGHSLIAEIDADELRRSQPRVDL